jgi:hypothetical protein
MIPAVSQEILSLTENNQFRISQLREAGERCVQFIENNKY